VGRHAPQFQCRSPSLIHEILDKVLSRSEHPRANNAQSVNLSRRQKLFIHGHAGLSWHQPLRALLLSLICLFAAGCASSLTPLPPKGQRGYQTILDWSHQNGMPGAVLLVRTPTTNFISSVGLADVNRKIPMRTDHGFRIGSVTKAFTGIVAAQLQAEGRLEIERPITNYLPASLTIRIPNSEHIRVRHMIRHQSGIYNVDRNWHYEMDRWFLHRQEQWPPMRMLEYCFDQPPVFAPGEYFGYSNPNYILLGLVIDQVAQRHHAAEIRARLLEPLRLTNTYYEVIESPRVELAHGYERLNGFRDTYEWTPVIGGGSGLVSTVSDVAAFLRAVTGTNSVLDEATRRIIRGEGESALDGRGTRRGPVQHYNFGLDSTRANPALPLFYGHRGVAPGFLCIAWHDPEDDITVVYFGSSAHLQMFNSMKRTWEFYARLEEALFEDSVEATRGRTITVATDEYAPRAGSDLQGTWTGVVSQWPFSSVHLNVRIAEPRAGAFRGELDCPDEAANCQPLAVNYNQPEVELAVKSGAGKFRGRLNKARTKIIGDWIRQGQAKRVTLTRVQMPPNTIKPDVLNAAR
jgi:D-alanyl-D-alanine carboxypeptidase